MATKPQATGVVTIGYRDYLMPSAVAMKVVGLMQEAVEVEHDFTGHGVKYLVGDAPRIEYKAVRAGEIAMPPGAEVTPARRPAKPKALTQQSLRPTRKD